MAGASAADVRSILSLPNPTGPMIRKPPVHTERAKKPGNISRELYSLIGPGIPTISAQMSKPRLKQKPNFSGAGKVKWEQQAFKNQARSDSLKLTHWAKAGTDPDAGYPFAKYNIQPTTYVYSQDEFTRFLQDPEWTKEETDYLFDLVREYDSRFYIVDDRYNFPGGPPRTLEDLKDRYFSVCRKLVRNRPWAGDEASKNALVSSLGFDKDKEMTRKRYLASLEDRTADQIAEEDALFIELKRLEQNERRFRRERDEILRTLLGVESGLPDVHVDEEGLIGGPTDTKKKKKGANAEPDTPVSATPSSSLMNMGPPLPKRAQSAKSAAYDALHCIHRTEVPPATTPATKAAHQPVYLRSYKLPAPKITAAPKIAQVLAELGVSHTRLVMPTRDNCTQLESLIEAAAALVETKKVVDKVEQDIRVLKARFANRQSESVEDGNEDGEAEAMDVDEMNEDEDADGDADGDADADADADADGGDDADGQDEGIGARAQSVVSTRSTRSGRSRQQTRRSMSISSVDTSGTARGRKRPRESRE